MKLEDQRPAIQREIVRALSRVGGAKTVAALLKAVISPDESVRAAAAISISELVSARPHLRLEMTRLQGALRHIAALAERDTESLGVLSLEPNDPLFTALPERRLRFVSQAFRLLEARYPKAGLSLAEDNLGSIEKTRRANALEVVENVLEGETSRLLMPLLEDIAGTGPDPATRLARGLEALGLRPMSASEKRSALLADSNAWVRPAAIRSFTKTHLDAVVISLPELVAEGDPLVQETPLTSLVPDSVPAEQRVLLLSLAQRAESSPSSFVRSAGRALSDVARADRSAIVFAVS